MKRSTVITHQEEKGSSFSKATFQTSDSATDISIDDPDFWKKWAKKAQIEEIDEATQLMMVEPRKRKQVDYNNESNQLPSDLDSSEDDEDLGTRSRDQRIRDKLRSLKHHGGREGRRRRGRGGWEDDDDDYNEDERDIEYGSWAKNDLFRLEKAVMTYGWGRWEDIMCHAQLRRGWTNADVEVRLAVTVTGLARGTTAVFVNIWLILSKIICVNVVCS